MGSEIIGIEKKGIEKNILLSYNECEMQEYLIR